MAGRPKFYVHGHVPLPQRRGPACGHPLGYIGTDVFARYLRMTGHNVLHPFGYDAFGLPAEQYAVDTGQHPRITTAAQHRQHAARSCAGWGWATTRRREFATTDVGLLQVDAVDLPEDLQQLVRHRRRTRRGRSRSWSPSSSRAAGAGQRRQPGRPAVGRADRACSGGGRSTATAWPTSPRSWSTGARAWAPCWPTRRSPPTGAATRQLPGVPPAAAAVDDADHRLRRAADRRPGPAGLARVDQADAAELDRRRATARASTSPVRRIGRADDPRCSPPARTRCSARPTWCWRPSTRWSTQLTAASVAGRAYEAGLDRRSLRRPAEAVAAYRRGRGATRDVRAAGRGPRQDRRVHRRLRGQPGHRGAAAGLHRRLRPDGLRHRRDHGGPGARRAGLGVRPRRSTCRSRDRRWPPADWSSGTASTGRAYDAADRPVTGDSATDRASAWTGLRRRTRPRRPIIAWLEARASAQGSGQLPAARLAVLPPAVLGRAVPDRLRRRRAMPIALPESMLPVELPEIDRLLARRPASRTT